MKKVICVVFLMLSWDSYSSGQSFQWEQTNGPWGGFISAVGTMGNITFASGENGAFLRSDDSGKSWKRVSTFPGIDVSQIITTKGAIIAGSIVDLYVSKDSGRSWIKSSADSTDADADVKVANDSQFFISNSHGVFRSDDGGITWLRVHAHWHPQGLCIHGPMVFVFDAQDGGNGGIYRSTDNGGSWKFIDTAFSKRRILQTAFVGTDLFVATNEKILYCSRDSGASWNKVNQPFTSYVEKITSVGNILFLGTDGEGVYRSTDKGITWIEANRGLIGNWIWDIESIGSILFAAMDAGIFRSTDSGSTWQIMQTGNNAASPSSLAYKSNVLLAGMPEGLYRSTNNGSSWQLTKGHLANSEAFNLYTLDTIWYATTWARYITDTYLLCQSTDSGQTWDSTTWIGAGGVYANNHGFILLSWAGGMYRLQDSNFAWIDSGSHYYYDNIVALGLSDSLFCVLRDSERTWEFMVSTDFGTSWSYRTIIDTVIYTLAINGHEIFAGTDKGIYRSLDSGFSWQLLNSNCKATQISTRGPIVFASSGQGLYLSTNHGSSWAVINDGLPSLDANNLTIGDSMLFVGLHSGGIYRIPIPSFSSVKITSKDRIASAIKISPNPTTNDIEIEYDDINAISNLAIFDALGRIVAQPAIPTSEGPGPHDVTIDTRNFPPGVYTARLTGGGEEQVARFVKE